MSATTGAAGAAVLLSGALLAVGPAAGRRRLAGLTSAEQHDAADPPVLRTAWAVVGGLAAALVGGVLAGPTAAVVFPAVAGALFVAGRRARARRAREGDRDHARLAGGWDLLAVCLEAGLPVPVAVDAAASRVLGHAGSELRRVAGLLELGADPADAWHAAGAHPALAVFARAARRSAATGAGIAQVARTEAERLRAALVDTARARAQRAAVLITGPLGLCFLPAFLALGIVPVVIGLAGDALAQW